MSSNLPSLLGSAALVASPGRRDSAAITRSTNREVALVHARAHVIAERGRANTQAIESVAIDAMQAGAQIARHATALAASAPPVAEGILRAIVEQSGLALGRTVSDAGRDLR